MVSIAKNWFLLQLKPNSHRLAERNLHRQGFQTFLPMLECTRRKGTKFENAVTPLFPGYLFVAADEESAPWRQINSTLGVSRLVCFDKLPSRVPDQLIDGLMLRCDHAGKLVQHASINVGDRVEVLAGPFTRFLATVEMIDSRKRIWILLNLLGQATRMQVLSEQLRVSN